ncbi:MAG: hypothetical protein IT314_05295 [Anaerolineales bacterium]|nr:hypothetical protein [Anaerolineales bacterium]
MLTSQNKGDYLHVEFSGPYSLEEITAAINKVAELCDQESLHKAFVDLRPMTGYPSILDRYELGIEIANVWRRRYKVAIVERADMITHMVENTAVNRGAHILTTTDTDQALQWLGLENKP